jgi:GrpB-like predicted nucleotidyltransferase (UPF0157 family)
MPSNDPQALMRIGGWDRLEFIGTHLIRSLRRLAHGLMVYALGPLSADVDGGRTLIIPAVGAYEIREYDQGWPDAFREAAGRLRRALGENADRIDHIGSTSVPGLVSKDVIDIQVSVRHGTDLDSVARALEEAGWTLSRGIASDHVAPGLPPDERAWRKVFLREPLGYRRVNVHVRIVGQPNQRYPLLFRDYLRAHPHSAQAYANMKKDLALILPDDLDRYTDVKDAACDLIYFAAEAWAQSTGWSSGPSDG